METPETNVKLAALNLMRFKMLKAIKEYEGHTYNTEAKIKVEELNEVLLVAGLPVIVPGELEAKEIDVIEPKED